MQISSSVINSKEDKSMGSITKNKYLRYAKKVNTEQSEEDELRQLEMKERFKAQKEEIKRRLDGRLKMRQAYRESERQRERNASRILHYTSSKKRKQLEREEEGISPIKVPVIKSYENYCGHVMHYSLC